MLDSLQVIPAASSEWSRCLAGVSHDFFHTAGHHLAWQQAGSGEAWMAVYREGERSVAWPYLLRPIELEGSATGLFDITSVDGYAGPLCGNCDPRDPFTLRATENIFRHWRQTGVVSVFARFHPLLHNQVAVGADDACDGTGARAGAGCLRHQGHTVSIDLLLDDAAAQSHYRESHLRQIRKAFRKGLTVEADTTREGFHEFVRLYHQTMHRNHADAHYFFSTEFLERLRDELNGGASIHLARHEGRVAGAVFITEYQGVVQYLLGGVEEDSQHLSPLKALLEGVRRWARERGNHTLHLGGGRGCNDNDPLFYFKSGFSPRRHCFYTGRWVVDQKHYQDLVEARRRLAMSHGLQALSSDFFPGYRAPLPGARSEEMVSLA